MLAKEFINCDKGKESFNKCVSCDCHLNIDISGEHITESGNLCDDCYFEKIGKVIELDPIGGHFSRMN